LGQRYWVGASMTKPADRTRLADNDRREIAKRIFDALCTHYPQKYVALVQPRDPAPDSGISHGESLHDGV
jgi:hypothetical protein